MGAEAVGAVDLFGVTVAQCRDAEFVVSRGGGQAREQSRIDFATVDVPSGASAHEPKRCHPLPHRLAVGQARRVQHLRPLMDPVMAPQAVDDVVRPSAGQPLRLRIEVGDDSAQISRLVGISILASGQPKHASCSGGLRVAAQEHGAAGGGFEVPRHRR